MMFRFFLVLVVASFFSCSLSLPTISAIGSKFFTSDGDQFFIKGAAYQLTQADPLLDAAQCERDASLMQTLGTNSIRVYHVDPSQDHSACMSVFENAGIYLWLDLDTFYTAILQTFPQWNSTTLARFSAVMDSFQGFNNLAGFWIGNEVITTVDGSEAAPFIKAATHDMKIYRDSKGYRKVPIGYSAADIAELRPMLQNYLACGDESESIDFFGLNSYEWCGDSTYVTSGYSNLQAMSSGYSIPIFFSETGCNTIKPRTFSDQAAIFGPDMVDTWSGSIIYEWIEEDNDYGLVSYGNPASEAKSGTPTPIAPDFTNLKSQWQSINPVRLSQANYTPSLTAPACPSSTPGGWLIDGNPSLPTLLSNVGTQAFSSLLPSSIVVPPEITQPASPSSAMTTQSPPFPPFGVSSSTPVPSSIESTSASLPSPSASSQSTGTAATGIISLFSPITSTTISASSSGSTPTSSDSSAMTSSASTSITLLSTSDMPSPTVDNTTPADSAPATTASQKSVGSRIGLNMFFLSCIYLLTLH